MAKGDRFPSESITFQDEHTGAHLRQITSHPSIHHHPFLFVPAYDDGMKRLIFASSRTGSPQLFAEDRATGDLIQLTDRPDLNDWSIYPTHQGDAVLFTAGMSAWKIDLETLEEQILSNFAGPRMQEEGMVAAAMGTTGLSWDDRWWAVGYHAEDHPALAIVDVKNRSFETILRGVSAGHLQFCPDDSNLLFYAGPLNDRVWVINRDGSNNHRLYQRKPREWITHETWIHGTRELAFVDWPHGIRCVHADTGAERLVASFNAWHTVCHHTGTMMVADTNHPDIGLQLFDPGNPDRPAITLCYPEASNMGEHWKGPFPYEKGPIPVYAPQHTHPHPSFSPDGCYVVFTSDRTGYAQIYEVEIPADLKEM
jgi:oligogalacturonide lyase